MPILLNVDVEMSSVLLKQDDDVLTVRNALDTLGVKAIVCHPGHVPGEVVGPFFFVGTGILPKPQCQVVEGPNASPVSGRESCSLRSCILG